MDIRNRLQRQSLPSAQAIASILLIILLIAPLVGMAAGFLPGILWSDFERVGTLSEALMAYATIVLALITGMYVLVTYLLLRESKDAREQDVAPIIILDVANNEPTIKNVGNGPASKVEFTLQGIPDGEEHEFYFTNIGPHHERGIAGDAYGDLFNAVNEPTERFDQIVMRGSCVDGFKNKRTIDWTYEIEQVERELHTVVL